jgi:hypothetical protein
MTPLIKRNTSLLSKKAEIFKVFSKNSPFLREPLILDSNPNNKSSVLIQVYEDKRSKMTIFFRTTN